MPIQKSIWFAALLLLAWPAAGDARTAPQAGSTAGSAASTAPREPGLYITFQTEKGNIPCKLYENESPLTVRTMVGLAIGKKSYVDPRTHQTTRKKFFDGLTFHRVIPNFMIQGGDPLGTGAGAPEGPGFPYKNENTPGLNFDTPGRLAMANAGPNTNASQFFVTSVAYPSLNGNYTVWGQCTNVDVVKAIAAVPRDPNDRPLTPVHILHAVVERVGRAPANAPEAMPATAKPPVKAPVKPGTGTTPSKAPAKSSTGTATGSATKSTTTKPPAKPAN
jgi:peptidyl-prolyl cis-trans isomerase A (cyclophilin A)